MSEKDFRPRLSERELTFLLEVVKYAQHFLDVKEREYNSLEARLRELRREVRIGNTSVWRELKDVKEQLQSLSGLPMWILQQRLMLRSLTRRLESILKGGKTHRHSFYNFNLNQALPQVAEPNNR